MFRKLLIWFGGLLLFSFVAYLITSTYIIPRRAPRDSFFHRAVSLQVTEAELMYQTYGVAALDAYLKRLDATFPAKHFLLDTRGRDVATGEDRSDLLRAANTRRGFFPSRPPVIRRLTPDGRYHFVVELELRGDPWTDLSAYGWIVLVNVLFCYVLAWRLVRPIRALHSAVERFGHGDLAARSNLRRSDELGQLARAFDQMATRIQTLLTAERRLLQDISHELRSPLTRLRFAIELAQNGPASPAAFARITKEVERLSTLVGELLQVTRAEGDPESRNIVQIDLVAFLRTMVEDSRIEAESRGASIELRAHTATLPWHGDRELLHRAVENVIRNAIRYTAPGSAVEVELAEESQAVVIRVRDHGPGVPEQELPKIFQPFYRVESDRSRDNGGVGLGLAIANRAVRLHHGEIQAHNAEPGLVVELTLPR